MERRFLTLRGASSLLLRKVGGLLYDAASWINPGSLQQLQDAPIARWRADKGDKTHRLYYTDLKKHSMVFDLGGYEGQWTSDIYSMYRCRIHVFEPVVDFAQQISRRFRWTPDIFVHQFGLSNRSWTGKIALDEDKSSLFGTAGPLVDARFVEATAFLKEHAISSIDLMKINIEGGEYDLLEHLLNAGYLEKVRNIQVQFHAFVPNAKARMIAIQERLAATHEPTFQYDFVWENWRLKDIFLQRAQRGNS